MHIPVKIGTDRALGRSGRQPSEGNLATRRVRGPAGQTHDRYYFGPRCSLRKTTALGTLWYPRPEGPDITYCVHVSTPLRHLERTNN